MGFMLPLMACAVIVKDLCVEAMAEREPAWKGCLSLSKGAGMVPQGAVSRIEAPSSIGW